MARPKKMIDLEPSKVEVTTLIAEPAKVVPVKIQGVQIVDHDKVKLLKNGKIIAMAVDRKFAERKCRENPNLTIL